MTSDYLYDHADAYNYIELDGLYPQQVDDFLSLFTFNPETLERIEARIVEEADIEKNNNLDIPVKFKTLNGYDENINGKSLGSWIVIQKTSFIISFIFPFTLILLVMI